MKPNYAGDQTERRVKPMKKRGASNELVSSRPIRRDVVFLKIIHGLVFSLVFEPFGTRGDD